MNKIKHTSVILVAVSLVSCGTSTRFGDMLIPAHKSSYAKKNEKVSLHITPSNGKKSADAYRMGDVQIAKSLSGGVVAFAIDYASKQVIEEIKNESKKYTQQYSAKKRFFAKDGVTKIHLVREVSLKRGTSEAANIEMSLGTFSMGNNLTGGYLDLESISINNSKAKVVSLKCKNPFKWAIGLLLKTGDYVNVQVHVTLKGVTKSGQIVILDSEMLSKPAQIALDKIKQDRGGKSGLSSSKPDFEGEQLGEWFVTGRSTSGAEKQTPLVIEVTVTETDPSNIQEKLQKGVDKIEEKRNTLLGN